MLDNLILFFLVVAKIVLTCLIFPAVLGVVIYWIGGTLRDAMDERKVW